MKKIICAAVLSILTGSAYAQSGTNSPYSQYGLGVLSDQTSGFNRGMNGLGLGFREGNQVNYQNPASYSAMDSLTFILDAGVSGQITNFDEDGNKKNANNAVFEYAVAGFRLAKHLGVSFGVVPFTNIGYNYSNTQYVDGNKTTYYTNTYSGSGGLHQVYLGMGWEIFKGLSLGVNGSYLWGNYTRSLVNSYSDSYVNTLSKYYTANVHNYKLDFGLQYTLRFSKKDALTIGATYGYGHKLSADPVCTIQTYNSQTGVSDTARFVVKDGLEIPNTYGVGLAWNHANKLKFGVDYSLQKWSETEFPQYSVTNDNAQYQLQSGLFKDRHKVIAGFELCPGRNSRKFVNRIRYRAGVSYATPYLIINGQDGPKEYGASVGLGIPIMNAYNNRSFLNISAQWVRQDTKTFITENTFRINIGLTFNERWFAKWKVE